MLKECFWVELLDVDLNDLLRGLLLWLIKVYVLEPFDATIEIIGHSTANHE